MKTIILTSIFLCLSFSSTAKKINTFIVKIDSESIEKIELIQQKFTLTQLVGVYEIKGQGYYIEMMLKDGNLYVTQSWNKISYAIKLTANNIFKGDGKSFVFSNLENDKAKQVTVTGDRTATFTRKYD